MWGTKIPSMGYTKHTKYQINIWKQNINLKHHFEYVIQIFVKISHFIAFLFQKSPSCMEPDNDMQILEFLLLGLSEEVKVQPLIFGLFLSTYLTIMFGNLLIILAITSDAYLHTSMYSFLSNLSFVAICFTSTTIPKMLWNILTQSKVISYK